MIRPCDMMVVAMSRLIGDGDTVFHGVSSHMPMIATLLAKKTHAPNAVHLNIPGGVDPVKPAADGGFRFEHARRAGCRISQRRAV